MIYPTIFDTSFFTVGVTTKVDTDDILGHSAYVHQIHGNKVIEVTTAGCQGDADGLWTTIPGLMCAIRVADCVPVVITRLGKQLGIAILHSGRQGTYKNIVRTFFLQFRSTFPGVSLEHMRVWIGPSICQHCYEFGDEVSVLFDQKYWEYDHNTYRLDVARCVYDQIRTCGIREDSNVVNIVVLVSMNVCDRGEQGKKPVEVWCGQR